MIKGDRYRTSWPNQNPGLVTGASEPVYRFYVDGSNEDFSTSIELALN